MCVGGLGGEVEGRGGEWSCVWRGVCRIGKGVNGGCFFSLQNDAIKGY